MRGRPREPAADEDASERLGGVALVPHAFRLVQVVRRAEDQPIGAQPLRPRLQPLGEPGPKVQPPIRTTRLGTAHMNCSGPQIEAIPADGPRLVDPHAGAGHERHKVGYRLPLPIRERHARAKSPRRGTIRGARAQPVDTLASLSCSASVREDHARIPGGHDGLHGFVLGVPAKEVAPSWQEGAANSSWLRRSVPQRGPGSPWNRSLVIEQAAGRTVRRD
jgi:hypothetical protein